MNRITELNSLIEDLKRDKISSVNMSDDFLFDIAKQIAELQENEIALGKEINKNLLTIAELKNKISKRNMQIADLKKKLAKANEIVLDTTN